MFSKIESWYKNNTFEAYAFNTHFAIMLAILTAGYSSWFIIPLALCIIHAFFLERKIIK